jgi:transcription elongation factor Elf1
VVPFSFDKKKGIQDERGRVFVFDGYHRDEAAKKTGKQLSVSVRPGTKSDAEWLALTANQKHGLRRSREDKRRVVRQALLHPYGAKLSNREIARHCGVSDKTVGKIRSELEITAEIPQLDKRIVKKASGEIYEIDTRNIGSSQPVNYVPVWELEVALRQWLSNTFADRDTQIQVLEEIKQGSSRERQYLEQLLTGDILPSPKRKRDVIQACHNVLDQNRQAERNNLSADEPTEHKPKAQEFECPRCGHEKIVGVNGSRRWCLNCGAEWSTAVDFLEEAKTKRNQMTRPLTREHVQSRFSDILARLEGQEEQLARVNIWLDELERRLALPENNAAVDDVPELVRWPIPVQVLENA